MKIIARLRYEYQHIKESVFNTYTEVFEIRKILSNLLKSEKWSALRASRAVMPYSYEIAPVKTKAVYYDFTVEMCEPFSIVLEGNSYFIEYATVGTQVAGKPVHRGLYFDAALVGQRVRVHLRAYE